MSAKKEQITKKRLAMEGQFMYNDLLITHEAHNGKQKISCNHPP